jgi:hypothetical protein
MFHQFDLIGLRPSLQRQLWSSGPQVRAASRRRRALRRRRLQAAVFAPARPGRREVRHA